MEPQPSELDRVFKRTQVVFWAFLAAPFAYVAAMFAIQAIEQEPVIDDGWTRNVVVTVLAAVSAVQLASRGYMAKRTLRQARSRGETMWEALATAEIMRMTLAESVAVYGLVLFLVTTEFWTALPFILVGTMALYASRPRKDHWREAAKEERT